MYSCSGRALCKPLTPPPIDITDKNIYMKAFCRAFSLIHTETPCGLAVALCPMAR